MGFSFRPGGNRQRKTAEFQIHIASIRSHECASADAECAVHDLAFETWWKTARLVRFRAVLVMHEHLHLGTERGAIERKSFFAAAGKEQVRLNQSRCHFKSQLRIKRRTAGQSRFS